MTKAITTIVLLVISNAFMTVAWYGHLKSKEINWLHGLGLVGIILISWGIAFFEYLFRYLRTGLGTAKTVALIICGS